MSARWPVVDVARHELGPPFRQERRSLDHLLVQQLPHGRARQQAAGRALGRDLRTFVSHFQAFDAHGAPINASGVGICGRLGALAAARDLDAPITPGRVARRRRRGLGDCQVPVNACPAAAAVAASPIDAAVLAASDGAVLRANAGARSARAIYGCAGSVIRRIHRLRARALTDLPKGWNAAFGLFDGQVAAFRRHHAQQG
mmetsp:Transcript_118371/g.339761  ORF Transcript_118371/g.339761 Transcript_118371/m.339761 type:complete len:201 (-) Transcript_118371:786-1388(-)